MQHGSEFRICSIPLSQISTYQYHISMNKRTYQLAQEHKIQLRFLNRQDRMQTDAM
uniref:Uncharacterized protein n=1 Tax=Arundo donax TaxID=35708 RepID=A0A0A8YQR4_ARUDO